MRCEICNANPATESSVILHRINEIGVKGIWRCNKCLTMDQKAKVDPEVDFLTRIVAGEDVKTEGRDVAL